jgi:hypothetical protein
MSFCQEKKKIKGFQPFFKAHSWPLVLPQYSHSDFTRGLFKATCLVVNGLGIQGVKKYIDMSTLQLALSMVFTVTLRCP